MNDALASTARSSLASDATSMLPRVLFVCVENSCRSQMAEAHARMSGATRVEALSGGSRPSGVVNPRAVEVMAELDYDLAAHTSEGLDALPEGRFAAVVTMGCGDACPVYPGKRYLDWELADPAGKSVAEVRPVRDELERLIRGLLEELNVEVVA